jgi:hypothetical protein
MKKIRLKSGSSRIKKIFLTVSGIGACMGSSFGANYSLNHENQKPINKKIAHFIGCTSLGLTLGAAMGFVFPLTFTSLILLYSNDKK